MNDDQDVGVENDFVFDNDTTLDWATVYEALGVEEPRKYTRRTTRTRKESSSGVSNVVK